MYLINLQHHHIAANVRRMFLIMILHLKCFHLDLLQSLVINNLGPASSVSATIASTPERPDRTLPVVSMNNVVSLAFSYRFDRIWLLILISTHNATGNDG